jgi:glycosyl transferase, family 25
MLEQLGIDNVYIIHAKNGYEQHEQRIINLFKEMGINKYEFMTDGDPSNFSDEKLLQYFIPEYSSKYSIGQLSCTFNHFLCYEKIVNNKEKMAIIFENDPFFLGDFINNLLRIKSEVTNLTPGFIVSLENTTLKFPSVWQTKYGQYLYEFPYSRCAGAYIIDNKGAASALSFFKQNKYSQIIDWWMNTIIKLKLIKMYWVHPPLTEQGSHNGMMSSVISTKNKGNIRKLRWKIKKAYRMSILRVVKNYRKELKNTH